MEKGDGYSCSGDGFLGRAKDYPLHKPMVDHDEQGIKASRQGEVSDEVTGDLLEGSGGLGRDWRYGGNSGMHVCLGLLHPSMYWQMK